MYVLEFRTANRHHTWLRCAICETKAPLERVRRGQPNMTRLRKMEKRAADAVRPKIRIMI